MSAEASENISCRTCMGACCQNVRLALSAGEAEALVAAGTDLEILLIAFQRLQFDTTDVGDALMDDESDEIDGWELDDSEAPPLGPEDFDDDEDIHLNWADHVDEILQRAERSKSEPEWKYWRIIASHARTMKPGQGLFSMNGRCGFLREDNSCADYKSRPDICKEFQVGEKACIGFRQRAGVDVPISLMPKPLNAG